MKAKPPFPIKKIIATCILILGISGISAQNHFVKTGLPASAIQVIDDLDSVQHSSVAFADIDGDTDQDILITGMNNTAHQVSKLYKTNGSGSFTLISGTPFVGVFASSVAFADIDGDNDQDILIIGQSASGLIFELYKK